MRTHCKAAQAPALPETAGRIRVLLVICRPGGRTDVPFRSVASHLVRLSRTARQAFQLDVLRPPTFGKLREVLQAAKERGEPYHVVHFDGHGVYEKLDARPGYHGYLLFEKPGSPQNIEHIDGRSLGPLLANAGVPVLVLNACRSAYADLVAEPQRPDRDTDQRVRAYGSLAQEVVHAGVGGVVAMRYNVYVVTAAQFVGDLYAALANGQALGAAVTAGRMKLHAQPDREIAFAARPLQDWMVPVVYETTPLALLAESPTAAQSTITLDQAEAAADVGFYGRDETLLALDRTFDTEQIVLLHAWAGAGKTSTAAEFGRWYQLTGGLDHGRVLFTAFTRHMPLASVLDQVGTAFSRDLERAGVHWLTLSDVERREIALQVLAGVPVLWIWDNVEPVAGFPAGTASAWNAVEQRELAEFLRDLRGTKAKVLLTSRRDERGWLGDLPARITLPPMPMAERVQLARALATKHGHRLTDVEDWRPLLEFTQGNPLTITVLVGQALHDGLRTKAQIEAFVAELRVGAATITDDVAQGRDKSLTASLSYGIAHAFTDHERAQLALLYLFQGFINVEALRLMGDPEDEHCLAEARGLTRQNAIALLDRAAEIGLLTAHGDGFYAIHPALPWFFQPLFTEHYGPVEQHEAVRVTRAYVEAIGEFGDYYLLQYEEGHTEVISLLGHEEANLLHARELARTHGWWPVVIRTMQGLDVLYGHSGRTSEWKHLVNELVPDFVNPATDGPLSGRAQEWSLVTDYRVQLARDTRDWAVAERLQQILVVWQRERATSDLDNMQAEGLDDEPHNHLRSLATSVQGLGDVFREQGKWECVAHYEEAARLYQRLGNRRAEAATAFNLGSAYIEISNLRDLDEAHRWHQRSLELHGQDDRLGRARCMAQLGMVTYERFKEARNIGLDDEELRVHWTEAAVAYQRALDLLPTDAVAELAVIHNQLGNMYGEVGKFDTALRHYRTSIHYKEVRGDGYGAGKTRHNASVALASAGRLKDALCYAEAALCDFERVEAAAEIAETQQRIARIEALTASQDQPS